MKVTLQTGFEQIMADRKTIHLKSGKRPNQKSLLTLSDVMRHAEAIIRFDGETALLSQQGVSHIVESSVSSLEELCGEPGSVKLKSEQQDTPKNIVAFAAKKRD